MMMAAKIPEKYLDLFKQPAFANLATLMPDGSPQVTPVWCDFDGEFVIVNSAKGRVKDRNMRARPTVALVIQDPKRDTRYIQIRGHVVSVSEDGALEHIGRLAMKYRRQHWKPVRGQVRVTYVIAPDSVSVHS